MIDLKKAGVADEVIVLMFDSDKKNEQPTSFIPEFPSDNQRIFDNSLTNSSRILLDPNEALRAAKTISIEKSSIHPSIPVLEKELMKRKEWKDLNLNIIRYKEGSDLHIEIGFVHLSLITHRYSWRVYDAKSGTIIAAGVATSWGSLAKNLAGDISKKLSDAMKLAK